MTDSTYTLKRSFRDTMVSCATGVYAIMTDGKAGRYGITMTIVTAVTDEPLTVMLCINRQSATIPILQGNRNLRINMLNDNQQDAAEYFAGLTDLSSEEYFKYHIWHRGQTGQLEVKGALAHLHGSIVEQRKISIYHAFFVQTNEIRNTDAQVPALLYFRRQFKSLT